MTARKPNGRLGDAVWAAMRDEYVTGNESYAEIAKRYGVGKTGVERHALNREANNGRTWGELRQEFQDEVSGKAQDRAGEAIVKTLARVREKAASVAAKALERLEAKLANQEEIENRDLINIAKLATTVKVELGSDPDHPLDIARKLDALDVETLRKLAE